MHLGTRKLLLGSLLAAFCVQTSLVYLDPTADERPALSELALTGRRIWHRHNCQVCHQIYGFGGFLGPDLTNAAPRLTRARLDEILTQGNAQMPAFHLTPAEIDAVQQFLVELDRTGVGVARRARPLDPAAVHASVAAQVARPETPAEVRAGHATFTTLCTVCHVPFQATPLGLQTAPDLTTVVDRLSDQAIHDTIQAGRPERGMPAWALPEGKVAELVAFLRWLKHERATLAATLTGVDDTQPLPWWEFK
ncbi:MAG: cytochrome c [Planctomycetes bacterium]|nr:cytochrome c [Planctomycetota bacterium]